MAHVQNTPLLYLWNKPSDSIRQILLLYFLFPFLLFLFLLAKSLCFSLFSDSCYLVIRLANSFFVILIALLCLTHISEYQASVGTGYDWCLASTCQQYLVPATLKTQSRYITSLVDVILKLLAHCAVHLQRYFEIYTHRLRSPIYERNFAEWLPTAAHPSSAAL